MLSLYLAFAIFLGGDSPAGVWRGESLCTPESSASCHNEKVVYYIDAIAGKPDTFNVRADKIVDGKAITMGEGPWQFDSAKSTLSWEMPTQVWLVRINGRMAEGTLTTTNKAVVRHMALTKDE